MWKISYVLQSRWQRFLYSWKVMMIVQLSIMLVATGYLAYLTRHPAQPPATLWEMVWHDEFDGNTLDTSKWYAEQMASLSNNELEYYVPENVSVANGNLILKSEKRDYGGRQYTSGAVNSYGKFSFTYGKVEIRARMPEGGQGIWPELWLLGNTCNPSSCNWPAAGANEIDILEQVNMSMGVYMTPHYGDKPGVDFTPGSCFYSGPDYSADFHVFSVLWQSGGHIIWYIDGVKRCEYTFPGYFNTSMYFILNTAIGGDWPGSPDDTTVFPQYHMIDYVRVYQQVSFSS